MRLLLASNNLHKVEELRAILATIDPDIELLTLSDLGDQQLEVEETGSTLEENAYLKARAFYELSGIACIADDTGLEADALHGAPGVHTARFAGENASYSDNVLLLLERMKGIPENERQATFRTVICYVDELRTEFAEGACVGHIATQQRGNAGFGYDPVFVPSGYEQSFAELSSATKNSISHRGRALSSFAERFAQLRTSASEQGQTSITGTETTAPVNSPSANLHPVRAALCEAAVSAALNNQPALASCIETYCNQEHDLSQMYECLLQIYLFSGFPASLEALQTMKQILSQRGISWYADDSEVYDLQNFVKRGSQTCQRIYTTVYTPMRERVSLLSSHLDQWMIIEGYGKVLSRPQLDLVSRELINVAILAATGWERQLFSHLRGALNAGADPEQCEMSLQIAAQHSSATVTDLASSVWKRVLESTKRDSATA